MKALTISDAETITLALQDEIRRSQEARYDHRLHAVLLIAQGVTCPETAALLGDSPRTVQHWVHRFEDEGFSGLADTDRLGRPKKLSEQQLAGVNKSLRGGIREILASAPTYGMAKPCLPLLNSNTKLILAFAYANGYFISLAFGYASRDQ